MLRIQHQTRRSYDGDQDVTFYHLPNKSNLKIERFVFSTLNEISEVSKNDNNNNNNYNYNNNNNYYYYYYQVLES